MSDSFPFDFSGCNSVNHLWPDFVERFGVQKSARAVRQALDLQSMQGHSETLAVLLVETCGMGLVSVDLVRYQTGLVGNGASMVLMLSTKAREVQLLKEL